MSLARNLMFNYGIDRKPHNKGSIFAISRFYLPLPLSEIEFILKTLYLVDLSWVAVFICIYLFSGLFKIEK